MSAEPPPPMPWAEYDRRVRAEWAALLHEQPSERRVQRFLERHPALVPGAHFGLGRRQTGHAPFPYALITQPALRGLTQRTPDFVWISTDSAFLSPVFIEIEAPAKRWLTAKGVQHYHLTQALHQLDEWNEWFAEPTNRQIFYDAYQLPALLRRRKWQPMWVLIYGRRQEDTEQVSKARARLRTESRVVIPYEHLEPDEDLSDYLCVRQHAGGYRAVSVPATVQLGPLSAPNWALIQGKAKTATANAWISPERREFLAERFRYWDNWAAGPEGVINLADVE